MMTTIDERKRQLREATERRVAVVRSLLSAHAEKIAAQLGEQYAQDAESTWVDQLPPKTVKGRDEIVRAWQLLWKAQPNLVSNVSTILMNERHAVAFGIPTETGAGAGRGAAGKLGGAVALSLYFGDSQEGDARIRCEEIFADHSALAAAPGPAPAGSGAPRREAIHHVSTDADLERVNLAVVNAMNTGLKVRDLDAALAHVADDAVFRHAARSAGGTGKEAIRHAFEERFATSSDGKLERVYAWCANDWVIAEYTWSGTYDGGAAPTGRPFAVRELHLFKLLSERIEEHWIFGGSPPPAPGA
jgi:ketosteroid isomerase-like protein